MFIVNFVPTWIFYLICIVGIIIFYVSQFAGQLPFIKQYGILAAMISVPLILISAFFIGANFNEDIWKMKTMQLEKEIAVMKSEQLMANTKLTIEYIDRPVEVIKEKTKVILTKIPTIITKEIDSKCEIPLTVIDLHNEAAKRE